MPPKLQDNITGRGKHGPSPQGTATFIGLRLLDIPLQYTLLTHGTSFLRTLHIPIFPSLLGPHSYSNPGPQDIAFGLPMKSCVLLALAVGSTVKQVIWAGWVCKEEISPGMGVRVGIFNSVVNSLNSLISLTAIPYFGVMFIGDVDSLTPLAKLGLVAYGFGISVELISEIQRKWFKDGKGNEGKVFMGGLFGVARHVNYTGYLLWRMGYALCAGGPIWAGAVGAFFATHFVERAMPVLEEYCAGRYGESWRVYEERTRWLLLPGVY